MRIKQYQFISRSKNDPTVFTWEPRQECIKDCTAIGHGLSSQDARSLRLAHTLAAVTQQSAVS